MGNLIIKYGKYKFFFTLAIITSLFYFSYHFFNGDHGLISLINIKQEIKQSNLQLDEVVSKKLLISHKVSLLREQSLDTDMLDEQVRRILGYSHQGEKIIIRR